MSEFLLGMAFGATFCFVALFGNLDTHRKIIDQGEMLCQDSNSTMRSVDWTEVTCENNAVIPLK